MSWECKQRKLISLSIQCICSLASDVSGSAIYGRDQRFTEANKECVWKMRAFRWSTRSNLFLDNIGVWSVTPTTKIYQTLSKNDVMFTPPSMADWWLYRWVTYALLRTKSLGSQRHPQTDNQVTVPQCYWTGVTALQPSVAVKTGSAGRCRKIYIQSPSRCRYVPGSTLFQNSWNWNWSESASLHRNWRRRLYLKVGWALYWLVSRLFNVSLSTIHFM